MFIFYGIYYLGYSVHTFVTMDGTGSQVIVASTNVSITKV